MRRTTLRGGRVCEGATLLVAGATPNAARMNAACAPLARSGLANVPALGVIDRAQVLTAPLD